MKRPSVLTRIALATTVCAIVFGLLPGAASAQPRGHGGSGRGRAVYVAAPVYYGYGFYDPIWWGYAPYFYPPPYDGGPNAGSARLQIKPQKAEVYVDGSFAGSVDDFDGFFQRLELPAGEHELTFYLDGYKTFTQTVLFRPRTTLDIKYELQPLAPGESAEPRPQGAPPPVSGAPPIPGGPPAPSLFEPRPSPSNGGSLAIRVQPRGASIFVDGEEWAAPDGDGPIVIELAAGTHQVEVRKEGLTAFRRTVQVKAGETVSFNVSLSK